MRTVIKYTSFLILMLLATQLVAQQRTFSVRGGFNYSTITYEDNNNDYSDNMDVVPGSHIGVLAQIPVKRNVIIETGVILNMRGFIYEDVMNIGGTNFDVKTTGTSYYLDIPVTYRPSFRWKRNQMYALVGPYIGIGFGGEIEMEATSGNNTVSQTDDIVWGSDANSDLKRVDYGLTLGIGYVYRSKLLFGLNYDMGFANLSPTGNNGETIANSSINIHIGYILGRW